MVPPGTWRGAVRVTLLLLVTVALALLGRLAVPALGPAWLLIAGALVVPLNELVRRRSRP